MWVLSITVNYRHGVLPLAIAEKCLEQRRPLFSSFIDLPKAFDLFSCSGLFNLLHRIGCPPTPHPKLLKMIVPFQDGMSGTVQYDGSFLEPFPIKNGVKQGCVLAPTLFSIFFSLVLCFAFHESEDDIFLHTRSDGSLFILSHIRPNTKMHRVLVRELLFTDDATLTAHSEEALQRFMTCFAVACSEFILIISLKKTNIMAQDISSSVPLLQCALVTIPWLW